MNCTAIMRWCRIVALLSVTFGASTFSFLTAHQPESQAPASPIRVKPLIAHVRELYFPRKGPPWVDYVIMARRGDGSYVRRDRVDSPMGERAWKVQIFDVPNRRAMRLEPFTKSRTTFYFSDSEMEEEIRTRLRLNGGTCVSMGLIGTVLSRGDRAWDNILGHKVTQVVNNWKYAREEKWVAPDLDCYPLRLNQFSPKGAHNEFTVTKLEEVEPPDSMFDIPPDYIEVSPLTLESLYAAKYPGHVLFGKAVTLIQERYEKHQKR
jgi:hypothetical protein